MNKNIQCESKLTKRQIAQLGKTLAQSLHGVISKREFDCFGVKQCIEVLSVIASAHDNYYAYYGDLLKKHKEDFEYSKRHFKEASKNGDKSVKGIIKILKTYDADQLISLYNFLKHVPKRTCCNSIFKRVVAHANREWGSPSYIVTNVLNGTEQELVSKRTKAYRTVASAVNKARSIYGKRNRKMSLDGVVSVRGGNHYIAFVSGGNNGHSDWGAYFDSFKAILDALPQSWIVEIDNDCCDDVHYALIGFRVSERKSEERKK